ncbi:substrate-binding domain-containing protein [Lichenicoccus sp.]|uniref:substrate-binding domain-containing protein n=1 Tax=Lichenicoccus sp. TaxID=2781899 RepID=UPI003D096C1E
MKLSDRLRCAAGCAAVLAATIAARPASADQAHPVIGFTVYDMTSFIFLGKEGAQAIADADGAKLVWASAQSDPAKQAAQLRQFIDQKVDAIVVAPLASPAVDAAIQAAKAAGIPVIVTNLAAGDLVMKDIVAYVGPDDVKAGESEAIHVVDALGHKGGLVVLQGPLGGSGELDRSRGIRNILAKEPDVHVLGMASANWRRTEAYTLTQTFITRFGDKLNAVICENDDMAIGAIQALREKNLVGKVVVAGTDGIKEGMRNVHAGTQIETNLQDAMLELGLALQVAVDKVQARPVPKLAMLVMPQLTKDNVQHYYDQMFVNLEQFKTGLPGLVKKNLASGTYAEQ